jgi:hypothetical protein
VVFVEFAEFDIHSSPDREHAASRPLTSRSMLMLIGLPLRAEGYQVLAAKVARVSPLGIKHIKMLGRYAFIFSDTIGRDELRRLHRKP